MTTTQYAKCSELLEKRELGFAASLNEYCSRWCKREHVECDALKD